MIVLNMIVKNESSVIQRCLNSLVEIIDGFVISDTGSTDDTISVIENWGKENGKKGIVFSSPWVNFEYNRNIALEECKKWLIENFSNKDYICLIDADDYLVLEDLNFLNESLSLKKDKYTIDMNCANTLYNRPFIFRSDLKSNWTGVLHEYLICEGESVKLKGGFILAGTDGNRNRDTMKYLQDALILERELEKKDNSRYLFYLAQSYRDFNFTKLAEEIYLQRFDIKEYDEERYISLLEAAKCRILQGKNDSKTLEIFMKAYCFRPSRLEAVYYIVRYFRQKEFYQMGYTFGEKFLNVISPPENDTLFIEISIYTWKFLDEMAVCACWIGNKQLFRVLYEQILEKDIPNNERERITKDLIEFS